jgi:hypothetical protein
MAVMEGGWGQRKRRRVIAPSRGQDMHGTMHG